MRYPDRHIFRVGSIATIGLALLLPACSDTDAIDAEPGVGDFDAAEERVEEVEEETASYIGREVVVEGEVEEIYGPDTFVLEETGELFNDDEILVIGVDPEYEPIYEGQEVRLTGEVRQFVWREIETEYDLTWDLDLQREMEAEYEGRPVIVAESTFVIDESTL